MTPKTVSASRITRTSTFWSSGHLSPFAMWTALPSADYYGDSVAIGLASRRRSRVPLVLNVSSVTEAPHSSPSMASLAIAWPVGGGSPQNANGLPLVALRCRRCSRGCAFPPLGIGVQAMQLSPYHAGLAGRHCRRLRVTPASRACSFPVRLSPSGEPDDPGTSLRVPPDCVRDSAPRPAAHRFYCMRLGRLHA